MTIFCLYIFDRHCSCVYYHDWHRTKRPKRANDGGGLLLGVSHALSPLPPFAPAPSSAPSTPFTSPRNTLASTSGVVVALNDTSHQSQGTVVPQSAQLAAAATMGGTGLPFDEEVKLVYGVILSLRNMIKRLSGRDESFVNYRTSTYKLHLFETVSGYRFVMLTDPNAESLRFVMRSIYTGPFLEYVVRNPLITMDSHERGVDNEYFRASVDRLVRGLSIFQ